VADGFAFLLAVAWAYKSDASLRLPYQDNLSALIHEPTFKAAAGEAVFSKARVINTLGNQAVHSHRPIQQLDALAAVRELSIRSGLPRWPPDRRDVGAALSDAVMTKGTHPARLAA